MVLRALSAALAIIVRVGATAILLAVSIGLAHADERILSYHSLIELAKSGKMTVTETIKVNAEGYQIKRGIYRDFPLTFKGDDGRMHRVDFSIVSIERDGQPDDYHTETIDNGIRIYIGKEGVLLDHGEHTYSITYETGRQIRYFPDHEELFWNVTGNGWRFAIMEASATVNLPEGVRAEATTFFTGPLGAKGKRARVMEEDGEIFFATTFPLNIEEGLTIGVKMPKGSIDPPTEDDQFWWGVKDHMNSIAAAIGLAVVLLFFVWRWIAIGRDPSRGIIVPRWDAPDGLSPALVNFVANKGFSNGGWTAFSASMIDLAVKGHLVMEDVANSLTLKPTAMPPATALPLGEDIIFNRVKGVAVFPINKVSGVTVQKMGEDFRKAIEKEHSGKYHRFNVGTITLGILLAILAFVGVVMVGDFTEGMLGILVVPAVLFLFVAIFSAVLAATVFASNVLVLRVVAGIFLGIFWLALLLVVVVCAYQAVQIARSPDDIIALSCCGAIVLVTTFFTTIMGAATPLGRKLMDGIEG